MEKGQPAPLPSQLILVSKLNYGISAYVICEMLFNPEWYAWEIREDAFEWISS